MSAAEKLERLRVEMLGSREWPLDFGSPLGRDYGQGWDLSFNMETAIKSVLRALPQIVALVEELGFAISDLQTLLDSDALTKTGRKKLENHIAHHRAALAALDEALP